MVPTEGELAVAELTPDEFHRRLRRLSAAGVIRGFKATLVVPPLLGGDWVWASALATADRPLGVANVFVKRLPFVTEVVINSSLPLRVGPNLAILFYSRDFDTEARYVRSVAGTEQCEVHRVADYSFPVARPLSSDEMGLLRQIVAAPAAGLGELGAAVGRGPEWVRAKLDRLLWTPANSTGILRVQPELDWTKVENFGHFHFLLTTGHRPDQLARIVAERGFSLVLGGRRWLDRYVQVEADCWGVADLMERAGYLDQLVGVSVQGVLANVSVTVNTGWVAGLLQ